MGCRVPASLSLLAFCVAVLLVAFSAALRPAVGDPMAKRGNPKKLRGPGRKRSDGAALHPLRPYEVSAATETNSTVDAKKQDDIRLA